MVQETNYFIFLALITNLKKIQHKKIKNLNHLNNKSINKVKLPKKILLYKFLKNKFLIESSKLKDNEETLGELFIFYNWNNHSWKINRC